MTLLLPVFFRSFIITLIGSPPFLFTRVITNITELVVPFLFSVNVIDNTIRPVQLLLSQLFFQTKLKFQLGETNEEVDEMPTICERWE